MQENVAKAERNTWIPTLSFPFTSLLFFFVCPVCSSFFPPCFFHFSSSKSFSFALSRVHLPCGHGWIPGESVGVRRQSIIEKNEDSNTTASQVDPRIDTGLSHRRTSQSRRGHGAIDVVQLFLVPVDLAYCMTCTWHHAVTYFRLAHDAGSDMELPCEMRTYPFPKIPSY